MERTTSSISLAEHMRHTNFTDSVVDYSDILKSYGIVFRPNEFYWQVGELKKTQGWILHLSVIKSQISELLQVIIPELLTYSVPFKIIRDSGIVGSNLGGSLGYAQLGKMASVYPDNDLQALDIAKKLIDLTKGFRGPAIPTDRHLGSVVYTRYGSFNPIIVKDIAGEKLKCIYDQKGELIPDPYNIPFQYPSFAIWPFREIAESMAPYPKKLLNYVYYPQAILKPDAKGNVIRALYFKKLWQIKLCLVKQGRMNMFSDDFGRDIQDRLEWQFSLYRELEKDIPLPEIFDHFKQGDDSYLAMKFIIGDSLSKWIDIAYNYRSWRDLPFPSKWQLLDMITKIIKIISRLHEKGYVHRDITPENFLIDKSGKIFLIDLELAWCLHSGKPTPPFTLGTPGFMSPEQASRSIFPTFKEDIYGLGALMLVFFTNLSPVMFNIASKNRLIEQIIFFTGESNIAKLVSSCLEFDPEQRPKLSFVEQELEKCREELTNRSVSTESFTALSEPALGDLRTVIKLGIQGLTLPALLHSNQCWVSRAQRKETNIGNRQNDFTIYDGWHTGVSGPMWLIAQAKLAGFPIDDCKDIYITNWEYLQKRSLVESNALHQGLYAGSAGIALTMTEGINSSLLFPTPDITQQLHHCLRQSASQLDLATGSAGQGIALLHCAPLIGHKLAEELLSACVANLLKSQQQDGSWSLYAEFGKKDDILTGLDKGVAGVTWFLLNYLQSQPSDSVEKAVHRALTWLIKRARKKGNICRWPISTKSRAIDQWGSGVGTPGIILTFIKAYEVLKNPLFQNMAEDTLQKIRPRPILRDFGLGSGLAGLGEIYLEAYRVFDNKAVWKERASWIVQLLIHSFEEVNQGAEFWLTGLATADLFSGNSGVLHFLIRYLYPEKLYHPLVPRPYMEF